MKNTWFKTVSISLMAFAVMTFSGNGAMAQEADGGEILPAAPLTSVQAVATSNIVFTKANYNIIFNTATAGAVKRLDITFPVSFNLTNAKLIEVDKIGAGSLTRAGQTFTYTVNAAPAPVIAAGTRIRIMIGDIVNNGNTGAQSVSVTTKDNLNVTIDGPTASTNPGLVRVTAAMIADGGVTTAKIAANAVDGTKIAPASIGPGQINNSAIQSIHIFDGTVGTADLADGAVTDAKITGPVSGAKINTIGLDADTVDSKHAADLQNRVTGVCAAGSSIRTVNVDGTVVCETNGISNQLETTGNLTLPLTTSSTGIIKSGINTLIHSYGTGNFFAGTNAGNLTMTGPYNTAIGEISLKSNTTGNHNTASGFGSLYSNTEGVWNTANGLSSLFYNTTGSSNTASGVNSLISNTDGHRNTANGVNSLFSNLSGFSNTASGVDSLFSNTYGSSNTAIGVNSLISNTDGSSNTAIGVNSLISNMYANFNTATGVNSLFSNTNGSSNTASGVNSLYSNISGIRNTASGENSLYSNVGGTSNTATGYDSLYFFTNGNSNTANGADSLFALTNGNSNTAYGAGAGTNLITGDHNTFIGVSSGVSYPMGYTSNATAIGSGAIVNASNKVRIGNTSVTVIEGQVPFSWVSDAREKKDIHDTTLGLDFITSLKPVEYKMKEGDNRINLGFLAQDIEATLGEKYSILGIGGDKDRMLSLRYTDFIAPLVKAVQELKAQKETEVASLKNHISRQDIQISELQKQLAVVMAAINGDKHKLLAETDAENLKNKQQ